MPTRKSRTVRNLLLISGLCVGGGLVPAAPAWAGRFRSQSVSVSVANGRKTVDVNDNGLKIRIKQTADGIRMSVTGVEDGNEVTEEYEAKDADELKRDNPEAYALYERWA